MNDMYKVNFIEEVPMYIQIANHIKELIENKIIEDGERLPTIRAYTEFLGVNKITIINTYKKLSNDGFAYQKMGSGTFAKRKEVVGVFNKEYSRTFKALESRDLSEVIDFAGETNSEIIFPIDEFKSIINNVLDRDGVQALISQNPLGYEKLRQTISDTFWNKSLSPLDILIVSGAQQGIDIISKVILNVNENVIVEKPTYVGALSVFKWRRANIFEVELEDDGINLVKMEEILKKNKISCFYTMSYFHNPTGISYSLSKKKKLLELAEKYDFYIIEDDYLSELRYDKEVEYTPLKWLDKNNKVIYIKSFSKVFLPGIRIGYIVAPPKLKEGIKSSKLNTDKVTSSLMQRSLEMYISNGNWKNNIKNLNKEYIKRYNLMSELIEKELGDKVSFKKPGGGLTFYLKLKDEKVSSKQLFLNLRKRNVFITPGILFFRNAKDGEGTFRIGFEKTNEEKIKKGLKIIREELN